MLSKFSKIAQEVAGSMGGRVASTPAVDPRLASLVSSAESILSRVHDVVRVSSIKTGSTDREAEWQRVNSYIADVLKDTHVLYAKLARLQGDFVGDELGSLEQISESVLALGEQLSHFSKAFYEGKLNMADADAAYGNPENSGGGAPHDGGGHPNTPPPDDIPFQVEGEGQGAPPQGGGGGGKQDQGQQGQ